MLLQIQQSLQCVYSEHVCQNCEGLLEDMYEK